MFSLVSPFNASLDKRQFVIPHSDSRFDVGRRTEIHSFHQWATSNTEHLLYLQELICESAFVNSIAVILKGDTSVG